MNRDEIVATMVRARECCRQIVTLYESVRSEGDLTKGAMVSRRGALDRANRALAQMLQQMKRLPARPAESVTGEDDRLYVSELFAEISALLEKAMILEREVRSGTPAETGAPAMMHGARAMKAYGLDQ